jgi:hypothetical protein
LIYAPTLGFARPAEFNTEQLVEPIGNATSATVDLRLSLDSVEVYALTSGQNLIEADIRHYGQAYLTVTGDAGKKVVLGSDNNTNRQNWFTWPAIGTGWPKDLYWKIGLTNQIPLDLNVDGSLGSSDLDLRNLKLTDLNVGVSLGSMDIRLPESADGYAVDLNGSAGSLEVFLPANTSITLHLEGSAGSTSFSLPANYALRVEVLDGGLGSVNLPHDMLRLSGSGDTREGVWESPGYTGATNKLLIVITHVGPGSITIH